MARRRELERAKRRLLEETNGRDWVQSVGVGSIDGKLGLVLSVRARTKPAASRLLNRLDLKVPIRVRAVRNIQTQAAKSRSSDSETKSINSLRSAAMIRLSKNDG